MIYTYAEVRKRLDAQNTEAGLNRWLNISLAPDDTAWNPIGEPFSGPGDVTYGLYAPLRGGGLYASFTAEGEDG